EELILWEKLGRSIAPDLVLLAFYPNDVRNNEDRGFFDLHEGRVLAVKEPPLPNVRFVYDVRKWLASHSHVYMLFKQGLDALAPDGGDGAAAPAGASLGAQERVPRGAPKDTHAR